MRRFLMVGSVFLLLAGAAGRVAAGGGEISGKVTVLTRDNQPLGDNSGVVVYLEEVGQNKGFDPPKTAYTMASEDMEFTPEVLPILVGSTVAFPNRDTTLHNAFSISKAKPFDLGSYGQGPGKKVVFHKTGVVNVNCNLHPEMAGYIMVLSNPYFMVTDEKGNFALKGVPPGSYTLACWFPYGFIQEKTVELAQSASAKVDIEMTRVRDEVAHKNKYGKDY
jgi:plastocyanin